MDDNRFNKLMNTKHLSDYTLPEVLTEIGLYHNVLIDVGQVRIDTQNGYPEIYVSKDIEYLHELLCSTQPIILPCSECKADRPYNLGNPEKKNEHVVNKIYAFGNNEANYYFASSYLKAIDKATNKLITECKSYLLNHYSEFKTMYMCTYDGNHVLYEYFILFPLEKIIDKPDSLQKYEKLVDEAEEKGLAIPEITKELEELYKQYNRAFDTLVLRKVGQYPSQADMQLFDTGKYRKILKDDYNDLTMALGLYASGVGCGSFLYLRRIFEKLVEEAHQRCKSREGWNEDEYQKSKFKEKINILEDFKEVLIPSELDPVRAHLYGVLSNGVHSCTEEECRDIFPYLKIAIELILDQKLSEAEKKKKIQEAVKAIQAFS